ncbi:c-type cytochrome [Pseudoduganella albidiflava]|uniref:C-type cytochrome n=2 Tax=Pseudoduganella albidiflava TaxID=321983 RepID=A0ABX5RTE0_9BURK|nr:c-type cytochrome [Pseudoduganella albidiflava]
MKRSGLVHVPVLLIAMLPALNANAAPAADPKAGAAAFRVCASCHQVGPGARNAFGPHLNQLFGRRAGSTQYAYSAAMKKSPVVWNDKTLAAFLRDPDDVVPGTKMRLWGYSDERKIANLLAYLRQYQ